MKRREYVIGMGSLGVTAGVAGCFGEDTDTPGGSGEDNGTDPDGDGGGATDTAEPDTEETPDESDDQQDPDGAADPAAAISAFMTAVQHGGREDIAATMHPESPLNPANYGEEWEANFGLGVYEDVETGDVDTGFTADSMLDGHNTGWLVDEELIEEVFDDEEAALVAVELSGGPEGDGTQQSRWVAATVDGEWLAFLPEPTDPPESPLAIQAQVVEEITFEDDTATVTFLDVSGFEQATVATESGASTTVDAPETATVDVDPDGDTVVVTATVGGEQEEVHREGYPTDERFVDHIEIENEEIGWALVHFTGETDADEMHIASASSEGEASTGDLGNVNYIGTGFDPDGDELVVRLTTDGEDEVVHRERFGGTSW